MLPALGVLITPVVALTAILELLLENVPPVKLPVGVADIPAVKGVVYTNYWPR